MIAVWLFYLNLLILSYFFEILIVESVGEIYGKRIGGFFE